MAEIVGPSGVTPVAASFSGRWSNVVAGRDDDWGTRFPTAYSFCFEAIAEQLTRYSGDHWDSEPVAMIFSRQDQFASRAIEIYDHFKYNGHWPNIIHCGYSEPEHVIPLQVADMIAYETRRWLWKRDDDPDAWVGLPLINRLVQYQGDLVGWAYDEESALSVKAQTPGVFLKRPPGYELSE